MDIYIYIFINRNIYIIYIYIYTLLILLNLPASVPTLLNAMASSSPLRVMFGAGMCGRLCGRLSGVLAIVG